MASGIWPAVSGAMAQSQAVDTVSNNLSNMDTQGFKKDAPAFREYLTILERDAGVPDVSRGPITDKEFHRLDGSDQSFVIVDGTYTDFKPGVFNVTQRPLDVALKGPGFFEVSTPEGVRYTKQGSFKLAKDGQLVTTQGYPVLAAQPGGLATALPAPAAVQPSQGGQPTQGGVAAGQLEPGAAGGDPALLARVIDLRDRSPNISINQEGEIYDGEEQIAKLSVVEFDNLNALRKTGSQQFRVAQAVNVQPAEQTAVLQGMIETSNVNPIEEMTNLIKSNRLFEHNLKAIKTYDQLMDKESNEIGVVR